MSVLLKMENITKVYNEGGHGQFKALDNVSFRVGTGEFVSIAGKSGSGKSTLLNIIGLLDDFSSGQYYLNEMPIATHTEGELAAIRGKNIGFVFQRYNLITNKTIIDNIALPLYYQRVRKDRGYLLAEEVLDKVGLGGKKNLYPYQLSGESVSARQLAEPSLQVLRSYWPMSQREHSIHATQKRGRKKPV